MYGYIDGIDWLNAQPMKYWSFPASYKKDKVAETKQLVYGGEYIGALKVDGYYERILKDEDGNCFLIARNKNVKGEPINKYEWVPQLHSFYESLPNGTCLLAEIYLPNNEGSKKITSLLGCLKDKCIKRQEQGQKLHLYIFDLMAYNGINYHKDFFQNRINELNIIKYGYKLNSKELLEYVEFAEYYEGDELWQHLQDYLAEGREGMVIMKKDAPVYFKRTPARVSIKIKKELQETIDAVIIGALPPTRLYHGNYIDNWEYWEEVTSRTKLKGEYYKSYFLGEPIEPVTKTYYYNWAGSLRIGAMKDGKITEIGTVSGITEDILSNWKDYVGKVCEIGAMEVMDNGLRHPKFLGIRDDLKPEDTDWYRIFN